MSLRYILDSKGFSLPAAHTLGPLINKLSHNTLMLIHRAQLADVLEEGLDTFKEITIDSTAVKASSCWPTDSSVIFRLIERAYRLGGKLERFGLSAFKTDKTDKRLQRLQQHARAISLLGTGAHRKKHLTKLYNEYFACACQLNEKLLNELKHLLIERGKHLPTLCPSRRKYAQETIDRIEEDALSAVKTLHQRMERIRTGVSAKARERVLSLGDKTAAYIEKGGRNPLIGYKPQLARSGQGFVTALIVEAGNGADSDKLLELTKLSLDNTGIVHNSISADDGYSSTAGVASVKELKVEHVSISGSKGRALLGDEVWNSADYKEFRNNRSAVESLMFTLKHNHGFGQLDRRGIEAVRSELTLKVIAYNFDRTLLIRQRKLRESPPQTQAAAYGVIPIKFR